MLQTNLSIRSVADIKKRIQSSIDITIGSSKEYNITLGYACCATQPSVQNSWNYQWDMYLILWQFRIPSFGVIYDNMGWVFQRVFADKARKFLYLCWSFMASERLHLKCKQNKIINTKAGMYWYKGNNFLTYHESRAILSEHIQRLYQRNWIFLKTALYYLISLKYDNFPPRFYLPTLSQNLPSFKQRVPRLILSGAYLLELHEYSQPRNAPSPSRSCPPTTPFTLPNFYSTPTKFKYQ